MIALRWLALSLSLSLSLLLTASLGAAGDNDPAERKVALKNGDRILFFGDSLTALAGKDDPKLEEFAEVQRQVARAKQVPLNDLRKAFVAHWKAHNPDNKGSGILTYDGNHFNDAGHRFVAEQMLKRFQ